MKKRIAGITLFALLLGGCGQKVKTFDYYKAHFDEAAEVAKKCYGTETTDPKTRQNCRNAANAVEYINLSKPVVYVPQRMSNY